MNDFDKLQALFAKAVNRLQQGDAAGAKQGLLKVVKQAPQSAVAWYNLGLCHQHLNENRKAIAAYNKAVEGKRDFIDAWVNLGLSYKAAGERDQAQAVAERGAALDADHPRVLNLLGTLAAERGEQETARASFEKSLQTAPDFDDARFNLANLYLTQGDAHRALEVGQPLFQDQPDKKEHRQLYAQILLDMRRHEEASKIIKSLEDEFPDDEATLRLGLAFREVIRDHFGAIDVADKLLGKVPEDAAVWNSLGVAYFQVDSIQKSKSYYERAIALSPQHAEYENNLGLACSSLGDKESAEHHYRRSLQINPEHAEAYRNIAAMKRFSSMDDPDAQAVKTLWDREDLDEFSAIKLSFALGKIYDDCGLYDQAFAAYQRGNELKFKESKIDLDKYFAHMARIPEVFDRSPATIADVEISPRPIFILGMPRSGTTLVEQIVARHPDVFGCGELPCIERAINRLEKKSKPMRVYPDDFWDVPLDAINGEALEYESWVKRLHEISTPYITDKMPFNFVHVWLIKALFPNAAIVHCQRHPLDIITSNYFQLYGSDISFVYDLQALGTYYVRYHQLMQHWSRIFGNAITHIKYEELIQDADTQTKRLIEAIGLPWHDACFDPKRSDTAVRTASIWQVRQGIYTRSKERWRHYERQLAPAIEILQSENILADDLSVVA